MAEKPFEPKTYFDMLGAFEAGMNSGVAPVLLKKNQLSMLINGTVRGAYATDRAPVQRQTLIWPDPITQHAAQTGVFQGASPNGYRPDFGPSQLVAVVSGRIYTYTLTGTSWTVKDVTITGDTLSPSAPQIWMWQSEKWLIISDGSGSLPIFYDGVSCRRSYGPSVKLGTVSATANPNPPALNSTINVTLTSPWTGPYNVPVFFNGAFYEPTQNAAGTYTVILKALFIKNGGAMPIGTNVVVNTNKVGYVTADAVQNSGIGFLHLPVVLSSIQGLNTFGFYPSFPPASQLTVSDTDYINFSGFGGGTHLPLIMSLNQIINAGANQVQLQSTIGLQHPLTIHSGAIVTKTFGTDPVVSLGNTTGAFTSPPVGSSVNVQLNQLYSGPDNQVVWIGDDQYLLSKPPPPGSSTTLTLINLTDTTQATPYSLPQDITSVPEMPACRMGAYGMGRNWVSLTDGISFIGMDIVGSSAGTIAYNFRDAVLKNTQNTFLTSGTFRLPGSGDIITSMTFTANLDQALGQGPLQIGTASTMFSCNAPVDNTTWQTLTNPLLTESLIGFGPLAQNSTLQVNSDTMFRATPYIGSLILARRDFDINGTAWGNSGQSREMIRVTQADTTSLLNYSSAIVFDNRLRMTCAPNVSGQGTFHMGEIALNFDLISTLRGKAPPVYDGLWEGLNVLQYCSGLFGTVQRAFAFTFNITDSIIELFELLPTGSQHLDNGTTPIKWVMETPMLFNSDVKPLTEIVKLLDGELYVSDVQSTVHFKVQYRPLFQQCWVDWTEFDVCADMTGENAQPLAMFPLGLSEPSPKPCDSVNNRPMRESAAFQLRIEITGHCVFWGGKFMAVTTPQPKFAKPVCKPVCATT